MTLKLSMFMDVPFPKLKAKAAEVKNVIKPLASVVGSLLGEVGPGHACHRDLEAMLRLLELSARMDTIIDECQAWKLSDPEADELARTVRDYNLGLTRLCREIHGRGLMYFNFVPKNHYLFHISDQARHLNPKLAWCYSGEDMMMKVKKLSQASMRGTPAQILSNKVLTKYVQALQLVLQ